MNIEFKFIPHGSKDWLDAVKLREDILRRPLGGTFSPAELEEEKKHHHLVGKKGNSLIATAVLVPEGRAMKMQRVVVLDDLRNAGIGSTMMHFCEDFAREHGCDVIYCHARDSAVNFYLKNGYSGEGDYFDEDGIPHLKLKKNLS